MTAKKLLLVAFQTSSRSVWGAKVECADGTQFCFAALWRMVTALLTRQIWRVKGSERCNSLQNATFIDFFQKQKSLNVSKRGSLQLKYFFCKLHFKSVRGQ